MKIRPHATNFHDIHNTAVTRLTDGRTERRSVFSLSVLYRTAWRVKKSQHLTLTFALVGHSMIPGVTMTNV